MLYLAYLIDMLARIEQDRPSLPDFHRLFRLGLDEQKAHSYLRFSNPAMMEAGLKPTSREGIWLFIAEESLSFRGERLADDKKIILLDLFSVLRRMYKSADDLWDQSPTAKAYIMADPAKRVLEPLSWDNHGVANITDMPLALKYLNTRLESYFPQDNDKRTRILESYRSFIQDATSALVDFEHLKRGRQPGWADCLDFYKRTTGRIGRTVGQVVGEVTNTSEETTRFLEEVFGKASVVSQIVDDIIDSPLDLTDNESPSLVKALLQQYRSEQEALIDYAIQISHRKFHQLAPQTDNQVREIFENIITDIPSKIQRFLNDFYYALLPSKVSHADPLNKGWHTCFEAHGLMERYLSTVNIS